jgi:hypothetical protein
MSAVKQSGNMPLKVKYHFISLLLISLFLSTTLNANALKNETSPYLLQHASNPVNWVAWSPKAFAQAKKEHKPVFLSIGYSTCHWCHVMEKQSFTDKHIAKLLNDYFVCIKVDREELPQVDARYQGLYKTYKKHSGGWPLNVFMTPQKKVFYISTYIPPSHESYAEGFDTLLPRLHKLYQNKKALAKSIQNIAHTAQTRDAKRSSTQKTIGNITKYIKEHYDDANPGFGTPRQFPEASKISLMLDLAELEGDKKLREDYFTLLDTMALHGLYDQIDGGFFRYCVDEEWEIPHFEKMLYTQAELLPLYTRAYILSKKELYKKVVQESIAMLDAKFAYHDLYFSASDADSDGEEGGYFIFTPAQITEALRTNPHAKEIEDAMGFILAGNIHDKVHLNFYTKKRPQGFETFQNALKKIRAKREYPFIDTKINTAWNAMMIEALFKAAYIDKAYAKKAQKHLSSLEALMFQDHELYHQSTPKHKPTQKGLFEDYAFFIGALIASYEYTYDAQRLSLAEYLLSQAKEKFYKHGKWYMSEEHLTPADTNDKYYTSALAKMVQNTIKLAALKESFRYEKLAQKDLDAKRSALQDTDSFSPALAKAYLMQTYGVVVLKSKKENLHKNFKTIQEINYPFLLTLEKSYDDYMACTLRQCFTKERSLNAVIKKINHFNENLLYNSK